ncbi:MAG: LysR family transcriptional regulator [Acidimicrobiales bacterium]
MRTFVKVAELGSFTAAATHLFVAQQAVSQQVKAIEQALGVALLRRTPRAVIPTAAGEVFLREAKRILAAADRLTDRTLAAARGEVGPLRVAYTQSAAFETFPQLHTALQEALPGLDIHAREVFASDIPALLANGGFDIAVVPRFPLPDGLASQPLREEGFLAAVSEHHALAGEATIDLADLQAEPFELWPRDMAPGYYDAVMAACRAAGFEPRLDKSAAGVIVWGNIAEGGGVGLVIRSLEPQIPREVRLVPLRQRAHLAVDLVWPDDPVSSAIERFRELARGVSDAHSWLRKGQPTERTV